MQGSKPGGIANYRDRKDNRGGNRCRNNQNLSKPANKHERRPQYITGTVKFFIGGEANYGFIERPGQDDVFFHLNTGGYFVCDSKDTPTFVKGATPPSIGDKVVFLLADGSKGKKAIWWGSSDTYEQAQRDITARPRYRVMTVNKTNVLWEGVNLWTVKGYVRVPEFVFQKWDYTVKNWVDCFDPRTPLQKGEKEKHDGQDQAA